MKRNVSMEEISDGSTYTANDMVKADCRGCPGCSVCCHGMGTSVILDPLDMARLAGGLGRSAGELLEQGFLELNVADGIVLPNLRMAGKDEACVFLNEAGRCSVHEYRPGICRLFPLGRYYPPAGGKSQASVRSFSYFLQVHECPYPAKAKVKVRKWIDTPDSERYERYIADWHYFLEDVEEILKETEDDVRIRNINLYLLKFFYLKPYEAEPGKTEPGGSRGFYEEFYERLSEAGTVLH